MQIVRVRVDGTGMQWAITQCRSCGEVHKYLAADVLQSPDTSIKCKSCGRNMSIDSQALETAVRELDELPPRRGDPESQVPQRKD
jgi:RNase P subunit RPR2